MTYSSIFPISLKSNYHDRCWKLLPKKYFTLHTYNEVSQFFAFNFVKRKVFVLAARRVGNPLNIQPQGLAADAWQKLLILIWKWWGSYWESRLTVLSCTCCYSLPPSLFGSWIGFPPSLSCFVLPSVLLYFHSRSPECLRMVENKIDKGSSVKLSCLFSAKMACCFAGCSLRVIEIYIEI